VIIILESRDKQIMNEMEVTIDITDEVAEYSVSDLINLLQFLQKSGFNKTYFDSYNASICLIRDNIKDENQE
jgi:hypothetical protein